MFVTFLVILFSHLSFTDITIDSLLQWYNYHPFIFILALQDMLLGALVMLKLLSLLIAFEEEYMIDDVSFTKAMTKYDTRD